MSRWAEIFEKNLFCAYFRVDLIHTSNKSTLQKHVRHKQGSSKINSWSHFGLRIGARISTNTDDNHHVSTTPTGFDCSVASVTGDDYLHVTRDRLCFTTSPYNNRQPRLLATWTFDNDEIVQCGLARSTNTIRQGLYFFLTAYQSHPEAPGSHLFSSDCAVELYAWIEANNRTASYQAEWRRLTSLASVLDSNYCERHDDELDEQLSTNQCPIYVDRMLLRDHDTGIIDRSECSIENISSINIPELESSDPIPVNMPHNDSSGSVNIAPTECSSISSPSSSTAYSMLHDDEVAPSSLANNLLLPPNQDQQSHRRRFSSHPADTSTSPAQAVSSRFTRPKPLNLQYQQLNSPTGLYQLHHNYKPSHLNSEPQLLTVSMHPLPLAELSGGYLTPSTTCNLASSRPNSLLLSSSGSPANQHPKSAALPSWLPPQAPSCLPTQAAKSADARSPSKQQRFFAFARSNSSTSSHHRARQPSSSLSASPTNPLFATGQLIAGRRYDLTSTAADSQLTLGPFSWPNAPVLAKPRSGVKYYKTRRQLLTQSSKSEEADNRRPGSQDEPPPSSSSRNSTSNTGLSFTNNPSMQSSSSQQQMAHNLPNDHSYVNMLPSPASTSHTDPPSSDCASTTTRAAAVDPTEHRSPIPIANTSSSSCYVNLTPIDRGGRRIYPDHANNSNTPSLPPRYVNLTLRQGQAAIDMSIGNGESTSPVEEDIEPRQPYQQHLTHQQLNPIIRYARLTLSSSTATSPSQPQLSPPPQQQPLPGNQIESPRKQPPLVNYVAIDLVQTKALSDLGKELMQGQLEEQDEEEKSESSSSSTIAPCQEPPSRIKPLGGTFPGRGGALSTGRLLPDLHRSTSKSTNGLTGLTNVIGRLAQALNLQHHTQSSSSNRPLRSSLAPGPATVSTSPRQPLSKGTLKSTVFLTPPAKFRSNRRHQQASNLTPAVIEEVKDQRPV